ncbi:hypothetical protein GGS26DRAFT_55916 [Hypomontagnella submonticulosa]|nr:hypothetical protein GGS26DRAFT_55916 [Hypomontagnella submonticulosa]
MTQPLNDPEQGLSTSCIGTEPCQQAHTLIRRIRNSILHRRNPQPASYPPLPRTSPERLALASTDSPDDASAPTVLYLAYGSNLSAETFRGARGIKPISGVNVSAPGFDLTFDLPGLPYWEPCFSNVTPRKLPKPPIPGDPPKFPPPPPSPPSTLSSREGKQEATHLPVVPPDGSPSWSKGLYGVVYEVTRADYATIIRTEGPAYHDVLTPCFALPPPIHVPEKPPIPELPQPFVAHTLYAPRLPSLPPHDGDGDGDGRDGLKWWQKLLLPLRRPEPDYAQPSPRYLRLIRDGAREHYLPDDYQMYLSRLPAYKITTWRQEIGRWLLMLMVLPFFVPILALGSVLADKDGKVPRWLDAASMVLMNLVWKLYDGVFKPIFGDGERTIEDEDEDEDEDDSSRNTRRHSTVRNTHGWGSEKSALLGDW